MVKRFYRVKTFLPGKKCLPGKKNFTITLHYVFSPDFITSLLSSLTQATNHWGSMKRVIITSEQWVTAVEDNKGKCEHYDALATYSAYCPLQDLQTLDYGTEE